MSDHANDKHLVKVVLDLNVHKVLTYEFSKKAYPSLGPGMRVEVPLKGKTQKATVLSIDQITPTFKVLPICALISEEKYITADLFQLAKWMIRYYSSSWQQVFKCILPSIIRNKKEHKTKFFLELAVSKKKLLELLPGMRGKTPQQAKVLDFLLQTKKGIFLSDLLKETKLSNSPIQTLIKKKLIKCKEQIIDRSDLHEYFPTSFKTLTSEQNDCYAQIEQRISANLFSTHLLFGITGSGKTEVYMHLMQKVLEENKTVIVLVPEVSLTSQLIEKFRSRFKEKIAVLHHRLSDGQKLDAWENIRKKKAPIVLGARSAVFCPIESLGLIIIDEEHDSSYKQTEKAPTYHARDTAIMRAKINSCPILLGSATPSLESFYNAQNGKYTLHKLTKRTQGATLPKIELINMKTECEKQGRFTYFSNTLLEGIKARYELGEQTLLFLNRRGYHSTLLCPECSHIVKCPHCDLALTFHKSHEKLVCHLCNYQLIPDKKCPHCKKADTLKFQGYGTEKVERSLKAIFPSIRTLRIDRDTTTRKDSHEHLIKQFRSGKADVLIGTQMISKGLHFPSVTLVGILSIDGSLQIPDFRSSEYCYQALTQVAGRSGRGQLKGEVILQSFIIDNDTIKLASKQDYENFYLQEIEMRKLFNYPPFTRMVKLIFTSKHEKKALHTANKLQNHLLKNLQSTYEISPVIPCGYAKVKDQFRFQFIIKGHSNYPIADHLKQAKNHIDIPSDVYILADIDPLFTYF